MGQGKIGGCYDGGLDSKRNQLPPAANAGLLMIQKCKGAPGSIALRMGEGPAAGSGTAAAAAVRTASMLDMRKCYYHKTI